MTLLDGENVVYVNTEVDNLLAIDRPLPWAEHATADSSEEANAIRTSAKARSFALGDPWV